MKDSALLWLRRFRVMLIKEFLQFFRDIPLILFMIYAFTLNLYLTGDGVQLELNEAPVLLLDGDQSRSSRKLAAAFRPPAFNVAGSVQDMDSAMNLLDQGKVMLVLNIQAGFQEKLILGEQAEVQVLVDTSNTMMGSLASMHAQSIINRFNEEHRRSALYPGSAGAAQAPRVIPKPRVWYNPNRNNAWFTSLTQLMNFITLFAILLPSAAMVREKEKGTVEQLLVTPLTPLQIMLPKMTAMAVLILAGTALGLHLVLQPLFDLPVRGSLALFYAVTLLYVFTVSGLGLLMATAARNLAQAALMTILIFGPMILLSGAWTPPEAMPEAMNIFLAVSPMHYYLNLGFGILLKGSGAGVLWSQIALMAGMGLLLLLLGLWRLRRSLG